MSSLLFKVCGSVFRIEVAGADLTARKFLPFTGNADHEISRGQTF